MEINIFNITELQQRKEPKKQQGFEIKIYQRRNVDVDAEAEKDVDVEVDAEAEAETETEKKIKNVEHKVVFKDKRKAASNLVDRELILKRLKMVLPVEKRIITQSTLPIPSPIKKKPEYDDDLQQELDTIRQIEQRESEEKDNNIRELDEDAFIPLVPFVEETRKPDIKKGRKEEGEEGKEEQGQEEQGQEEDKEGKKKGKKGQKKAKVADFVAEAPIDLSIAKIGKSLIADRLPKKQRLKLGVSSYYMNNRKLFINQLSKMFKPYRDKIAENAGQISCKSARNDSIDFELLSHQLVVRDYLNLYTPYRGLLLYHGLGSGKCHAKGTPIIMSDGNIKLIEDIQVGDLLMGDDSQPRSVLSLARGRDKMYNVVPIKGEKYTVNQEHILCLRASGFPKLSRNNHKDNTNYNIQWIENNEFCSKTLTFNNNKENEVEMKEKAELFFKNILSNTETNDNVCEISIKDYLLLSDKKKSLLKGYKVPIEFPEKELQIDPYMIGYWLGDGTTSAAAITCQDSSVLYYYAKNLKKYNLSLNYHSGYTYGISGNGKYNNNVFLNALKELKMLNDKHIPNVYKFNSRENRLKLLAGLLDSDGCYDTTRHCFEFTQKNEKLMDDVIYLCRSLGFACYKSNKKTSWTYKGCLNHGSAFRITISGKGMEEIPTLIPRKKAVPRKQINDVLVTGIKIEYFNEDDYYGFMLDGNCRYLMGDFTVTHNTCTSIGIAEGMKTNKSVVLMTPASLKMNFFSELKKCGDVLYKKNQFWEFISIKGEPQNISILHQALGLSREYISDHHGAWMVDITKASNFAQLSDSDQKAVDDQLNAMIRNKYQDINYNGLNANKMLELTNDGKKNPFDHKVVIIDEAHNLVSRIANAASKKNSIASQLYNYLMDATDVKIVFLTGTPIINTPREIGILFNMLRGYIKTWTFQLQINTAAKINRDAILEYFRDAKLSTYDFVDYSGDKLTITRNPFGFVNKYELDKKRGTKGGYNKDGSKKGRTKNKGLKRTSKSKKSNISKQRTKKQPIQDIDDNEEIYDDEELKEQSNIDQQYNKVNQLDFYEGGQAVSGQAISGGSSFDDYTGVALDEMGNISDGEFQKQVIRALEKNNISVIGKPKVVKELALPDDQDVFNELFINDKKGELMNIDLLKRRILGLTSYFRSAQEQLLPSFVKDADGSNYHTINIDMSSHQFELYKDIRKDERDDEARKRKAKAKKKGQENDEDSKFTSTYRIYSRSACNFAFPLEHPRPMLRVAEGEEVDIDEFNGISEVAAKGADDYFEESETKDKGKNKNVIKEILKEVAVVALTKDGAVVAAKDGEDDEPKMRTLNQSEYQEKIKEAYHFLSYQKRDREYLIERELVKYSPKFARILENIIDEKNIGLHLLYSQFRTLEGIGIFKLVLEANGFLEFKISKKGGEWHIENADVDPEKPRFVLYTGTETAEEKEIIRNIYNSAWEFVPPSIVSVLKEKSENNFLGEIIKVLMITSSGAEGINLRNTRFVHIMEPYWNMVRVDQVVGRARRICSHEDLPEELRTVQVFIYISRITQDQLSKNIEMRINDISKLEYPVLQKTGTTKMEQIPFSTDQYLFEIAQIKDSINRQILTAVKESAIDCSLYNTNPDEPLVCYGFGKVSSNNFGSYPILEVDRSQKPEINVRTEKQVLVGVTVDGVKYAMDKRTKIVYDFESYKKAKDKTGELIAVGTLDQRTQTILFDK